jgi:hypothetical protein
MLEQLIEILTDFFLKDSKYRFVIAAIFIVVLVLSIVIIKSK